MKYDPYQILHAPVMSESVFDLVESQNKLVFICHIEATKRQIRQAFEEMFEVEVQKVNTQITPTGTKRAYIRLTADHSAMDVALSLGMF